MPKLHISSTTTRCHETVVELQHTWAIENLEVIQDLADEGSLPEGNYVWSEAFGTEKSGKWSLRLHFSLDDYGCQLYLCLLEGESRNASAVVALLDSDSQEIPDSIECSPKMKITDEYLLKRIDPLPNLKEIRIKVSVKVHTVKYGVNPSVHSTNKSVKEEVGDFAISAPGQEIILLCDGQRFSANRFLLGARSEVFRAMLFGEFKEAQQNEVEINDVAPEVFKDVLHFVATDECPALKAASADNVDHVLQLLTAADKYQIKALCSRCIEILSQLVCADNAMCFMEAALLHDRLFDVWLDCFDDLQLFKFLFRELRKQGKLSDVLHSLRGCRTVNFGCARM